MPIREFVCEKNPEHVREEILFGAQDSGPLAVNKSVCMAITKDGPTLDDREFCGGLMHRRDIPTRTGAPQFVRGCGGFHRPTK